ncbi:ABC transporter ATP-binding protein [Candidatus Acetothermia bacterium]|nr:ABC transporter ATP-binding protein [Candidatus Acetothermia bacterium]MBI3643583.1 ABC transporter ATP-binding protein [Candidatus Acetothermia bacterium]
MGEQAVIVEGVSKRYRIGLEDEIHTNLSEYLFNFIKRPIKNFSKLRKLTRFSNDDEGLDVIWALKNIDLTVFTGEVLGIIGRNGSGKSTLLKLLSKISIPTTGRITTIGKISSLLEVGTGFHPELTGRENVYLNGTILGMRKSEIDMKFDQIVEFSEISKFIDTPSKRYSSGMKVRLAFAVAAFLEPEILIIDEVLAVGDAAFQQKCLGTMNQASQRGRTILFVSHNLSAVSALCTRAIWLDQGEIRAEGTPDNTIALYLRDVQKDSSASLRDREDREGNGKMRIVELRVENEEGALLENISSGIDMSFVMRYESDAELPLRGVKAGIRFFDSFGNLKFMCRSDITRETFQSIPNRSGSVVCKISQFPLPPGEYYLTIFLKVGGEWADLIDHAAKISVVSGDFFGTGRIPPEEKGGVYVNHAWELRL